MNVLRLVFGLFLFDVKSEFMWSSSAAAFYFDAFMSNS
jgi:hypothetical protein